MNVLGAGGSQRRPVLLSTLVVLAIGAPASASDPCFHLALTHTGDGADPMASPWGSGAQWLEQPVLDVVNLSSVRTTDVDGDGDVDLVVGELPSSVSWWENVDGAGMSWAPHLIDEASGPESLYPADIDGDGDVDVLAADDDRDLIVWWENLEGSGTDWKERSIDESVDAVRSVSAADVDGDGDLDALSAALLTHDVVWWENVDGAGNEWVERVVDGSYEWAYRVHAADLDDDGSVDLLATGLTGTVTWWRNAEGDGTVWMQHEVADQFDGAWSIEAADLDGDGDLDVVGAARFDGEIAWWENLDGTGLGWAEHLVDDAFGGASSVQAADIDWDGDLDLVGAAEFEDQLVWWENLDGTGTRWARHLVAELPFARFVQAADLDVDGDLDVVGGTWIGEVGWWENVDADVGCKPGSYLAGRPVHLTAAPAAGSGVERWSGTEDDDSTSLENRVVMPRAHHEVAAHYLEGCFALTLTHTGMGADPSPAPEASEGCPIGTYVVGAVIELVADPDPGWQVAGWLGTDDDGSVESINTVTMAAIDHLAAVDYTEASCFELELDHTGDGADPTAEPLGSEGCPVGAYRSSEPITLAASPDPGWEVAGWRGTDDDASQELTNTLAMPARDHLAGVDYILCSTITATRSGLGLDPVLSPWGDGTLWTDHRVADDFFSASSVQAADLDGDGDLDLVGAGQSLDWWENVDGYGTTWVEHSIDLSARDTAWAVDVDGDGAMDVVGRSGGIAWWRNVDGTGTVWTEQPVNDSFGDAVVRAADLDGDGDVDVIAAETAGSEVRWWQNVDGTGTVWIEHVVDGALERPSSVEAADLDHDDDLDLLVAEELGDAIGWWENLDGTGTVWSEHLVDGAFNGASAVFAADVDGDGDSDVVGAAKFGDEVAWWENSDGGGTAWTKHPVAAGFVGPSTVHAADLDGDAAIDLVSASLTFDLVTWWRNEDGSGTTWAEYPLVQEFDEPRFVSVSDLDGDGDPDVLGAAFRDHEISWWENVFIGTDCPAERYPPGWRIDLTADPAAGWSVESWSGTEDDDSSSLRNLVVMPSVDHQVAVHYGEPSASTAPSLTMTGSCPGEISIIGSQLTPFAAFGLLAGAEPGDSEIPSGICAGSETGLDRPFVVQVATADAVGRGTTTQTVAEGWCGHWVELLDATTCRTSAVMQIPQPQD